MEVSRQAAEGRARKLESSPVYALAGMLMSFRAECPAVLHNELCFRLSSSIISRPAGTCGMLWTQALAENLSLESLGNEMKKTRHENSEGKIFAGLYSVQSPRKWTAERSLKQFNPTKNPNSGCPNLKSLTLWAIRISIRLVVSGQCDICNNIKEVYWDISGSQVSMVPAPHSIDGKKFWAVVIGTDGYKTSPLRGCVSDAEIVVNTNIEKCTVPGNNSVNPCCDLAVDSTDEEISNPTCANIIETFLGLSTNTDIQRGSEIFSIYFAGHGPTYKRVQYFVSKDVTAAMLGNVDTLWRPIDRGPQHTASTTTPDTNDAKNSVTSSNTQVPDISDREINTILSEIARNKGNHITFIVDCCHSASIGRAPQEGVCLIAPLPLVMSGSGRAGFFGLGPGFEGSGLYKVGEYEYAKGVEGIRGNSRLNGVFTQALISAFQPADLNDKSMTYYTLITTLPESPVQPPVISGWVGLRQQRYGGAIVTSAPDTRTDSHYRFAVACISGKMLDQDLLYRWVFERNQLICVATRDSLALLINKWQPTNQLRVGLRKSRMNGWFWIETGRSMQRSGLQCATGQQGRGRRTVLFVVMHRWAPYGLFIMTALRIVGPQKTACTAVLKIILVNTDVSAIMLQFESCIGSRGATTQGGSTMAIDVAHLVSKERASLVEKENHAERLCRLERLEARLANDYGMSGDIDSVEVFDETKARAFTQEDASSLTDVKDLYTLYQLRVLASSAKLPLSSNLEDLRTAVELNQHSGPNTTD
ncbi:hypothetical protein EDD85DRAFT_996500 [Armillaria nabsnona]|nr:hypothetical protein EDD85DRAFT_996500 [Armillaria nabsnona]